MKECTFKGTAVAPWKVVKTQNSVTVDAGEYTTVSVVYGHMDDAKMANAHLIAAAPDLLQACISLVDQLCGDQEAEDELEKGLGITLAWKVQQAKVAIHKALNL